MTDVFQLEKLLRAVAFCPRIGEPEMTRDLKWQVAEQKRKCPAAPPSI
jgi:hypothetical protein